MTKPTLSFNVDNYFFLLFLLLFDCFLAFLVADFLAAFFLATLLSLIPYEDLTPEPVKLAPRKKAKGYVRALWLI
jgi:hypothetical protein